MTDRDHAELQDAILQQSPTPESLAAPKQDYPPHSVPYLNDNYTYGDRQNELELLQSLLTFRLSTVNEELAMVREINKKRQYPNIVFKEDGQQAG
jgi:hypothetical protein